MPLPLINCVAWVVDDDVSATKLATLGRVAHHAPWVTACHLRDSPAAWSRAGSAS